MKVTIKKIASGEYQFTSDIPGSRELTACSEVEKLFPAIGAARTGTVMNIDITNIETVVVKPKLVIAASLDTARDIAKTPGNIVLYLQPDGHDQIDLMGRNERESWYVISLRLSSDGQLRFYRHNGIGSNSFIQVGGESDYDEERISEEFE